MKKTIVTETGTVTIRGNGRWVPIEYQPADWNDGKEAACFRYEKEYIFLDEFIATDPRGIFSEYDGMLGFGYWSGLLLKVSAAGDAVQVYYFYC